MRRFKINWQKCLEGIHFLVSQHPGITPYYLAKIFYYADKEHLLDFGRPISGDRYVAMENGPVPSSIYDIVKRNEFLEDWIIQEFDAKVEKKDLKMSSKTKFSPKFLSPSDMEYLNNSLSSCIKKSFGELKSQSHKEESWLDAWAKDGVNNEMDPDLWITEEMGPRDSILEQISEKAAYVEKNAHA